MKRLIVAATLLAIIISCESASTPTVRVASIPENMFDPGTLGWTLNGGAYFRDNLLVLPTPAASARYGDTLDCPAWEEHSELTFHSAGKSAFEMKGFDAGDTARWHWEDSASGYYHYDISDIPPGTVWFTFSISSRVDSAIISELTLVNRPDSEYTPPPPPEPPDTLLGYPLFASPISLVPKGYYTTQSVNVVYNMSAVRLDMSCTQPTTVYFIFSVGSYTTKVAAGTHSLVMQVPTSARTLRIKYLYNGGKKAPANTITGSTLTSIK